MVFSKPVASLESHRLYFGKILDCEEVIDEGLLVVMRAPRSYTGEDTIEIHCHGGSLITRKVLEATLKAGAKAAGPGEFTHRAFLHGKIDLAQAEAVQTFIGAKNDLSLHAASQQLSGRLSLEVQGFQNDLLDIAAILEAWVDFPEEGLEFATKEEVIHSLQSTLRRMETLAKTYHEGKKIHEGLKLCLIGTPNAGKSSLLNLLLNEQRAIVTPIAGTTRDTLDAELKLGGLHFQITDTAGIRQTDDTIELEGIRRTKEAMELADVIFLLIDCSNECSEEDLALISSSPVEKTVIIWNKIDVPHTIPEITSPYQVSLSAKTGQNLDHLKTTLEKIIWKGSLPSKEEVTLTSARHKEAITTAIKDLQIVIEGLQTDISAEFLSADMRSCLKNLGAIIGLDISEEILSSIFAKFCVGK